MLLYGCFVVRLLLVQLLYLLVKVFLDVVKLLLLLTYHCHDLIKRLLREAHFLAEILHFFVFPVQVDLQVIKLCLAHPDLVVYL